MHLIRTGFIGPQFKAKLVIIFIEYVEKFNTIIVHRGGYLEQWSISDILGSK